MGVMEICQLGEQDLLKQKHTEKAKESSCVLFQWYFMVIRFKLPRKRGTVHCQGRSEK